jgi:alcohol dehydrogenase YqhD (iron-dependent ADH family)
MKSVVRNSLVAVEDPQNYEARSNIMWAATWALNTLLSRGKTTDWMVHMLGQAAGAYTDATHGLTLAAVSLSYYRHILPYGLQKFVRFAVNVWCVRPEGKSDEEIAHEGLAALQNWMRQIGVAVTLTDLGATPEMIEGIAKATIILKGGYKVLTRDDVVKILTESL